MMGWFWADSSASPSPRATTIPPHPVQKSNATPPPSCPMHKDKPSPLLSKSANPTDTSSCPIKNPRDSAPTAPQHETSSSTLSKLNPLNYMPSNLSQSRAPNQTIHLPVDREESTIPRGDSDSNWEYPSPQQMYNAMLRKGYDDTPQDAVESMVAIHNFLNEGAWGEIVGWETRFSRGLGHGWKHCKNGEEGFDAEIAAREVPREEEPRLIRFQGRPRDMTPKAKIFQMLGQVYPAKFRSDPPFDRHDWFVQRRLPGGQQREVRYVIDYYSAPPEPTGEPVFYLDVRPAVDGPTAAAERLIRWGCDVWHTASGAAARQ